MHWKFLLKFWTWFYFQFHCLDQREVRETPVSAKACHFCGKCFTTVGLWRTTLKSELDIFLDLVRNLEQNLFFKLTTELRNVFHEISWLQVKKECPKFV